MRVGEVMSRGIDPVDPSASVQDAAIQMAELDIGAVFVGSDTALTGVLTDRDIILRVVVEGLSPASVKVGGVMSKGLVSCKEDDTIESALTIMRKRQIRRMPVLADDGRAVGVVTFGDLAKTVSGPEQLHETLREISEPHRNRRAPDAPSASSGEGADSPPHRSGAAARNA